MKIALRLKKRVSQNEAFRRLIPHINDAARTESEEIVWQGWDSESDRILAKSEQPADLIVIDYQLEPPTDRPYIVLDPKDGAGLASQVRTLLIGENPPGAIWKNAVYRDLNKYNQFDGRWQQIVWERCKSLPLSLNWDDSALKIRPGRVIAENRLSRIKHRFGFESFEFPQAVLKYSPEQVENRDRPIDACFAGWMQYPEQGWLEDHRRACCRELEKFNGLIISADRQPLKTEAIRGRKMNLADYWNWLFKAKIALVPYGLGETTLRHFEAIAAGCLTIGPSIDWIDELQPHFVCKPDFSDLPELVAQALDFWDSAKRLDLREALLRRYDPKEIGVNLWNDIQEAIELYRQ